MRWPFRRKDATSASEAAASPAVDNTVPQAAPRRSTHHWATLPPLPVIVNPSAPLVMGPAPVLEPLPGPRRTASLPIQPATGRVEGLVHSVPAAPEPPPRAGEPQAPVSQPPLVHRPVHSGPPTPAPSLTDAVGSYVGEPREPAEPYRAPGWLRFVPEWLQGGSSEADLGSGSPFSQPEPPRPAPAPLAPPPVLPQRLSEEPARPEATEESTVDTPTITTAGRPRRRPNLGQSRRLGLGAPLKHGPGQDLVLPREPARVEQTQAPHAIESHPATPAPSSGPAESGDEAAEEAPEPPPAPPPQPPPLVHRPTPEVRAEEPAEILDEPVRPSPSAAGPVVPSVAPVRVSPTTPVSGPPASSVPLVYRSAPAKPEPARAVTRRATVKVPTELASAIRGSHGVDVGDVLVHRGPEVSAEARSLGARAFTRNAEVFLPEEADSLDAPKARGLLAHELVHVVQQRSLGGSLPALSSSAGMTFEAEAVAAEHEHAGHSGHSGHTEQTLVHPVLTQVLTQAARTAGVQLAPLIPDSISMPSVEVPAPAPSTSDSATLTDPVRQQVDQISEASAVRVIEQWTNPALGGSGFTPFPVMAGPTLPALPDGPGAGAESGPASGAGDAAEATIAGQVLQVINMDRAANGQPALTALDASALEQVRQVLAEQTASITNRAMMMATASAAASGQAMVNEAATNQPDGQSALAAPVEVGAQSEGSPSIHFGAIEAAEDVGREGQIDIAQIDLDELSARLYDRLRSRLRLELLIDRERAGLLTDFR